MDSGMQLKRGPPSVRNAVGALIRKGDGSAIRFFLRCKGKGRAWVQGQEQALDPIRSGATTKSQEPPRKRRFSIPHASPTRRHCKGSSFSESARGTVEPSRRFESTSQTRALRTRAISRLRSTPQNRSCSEPPPLTYGLAGRRIQVKIRRRTTRHPAFSSNIVDAGLFRLSATTASSA